MWVLLDERNGPEFDVAGAGSRAYVIASSPRSGSTLLGRMLGETGLVGEAKEWLAPMQIRDWELRLSAEAWGRWRHWPLLGPAQGLAGRGIWDRRRVASYLGRIREHRTGPSGVFGMKLHAEQHRRWFLGYRQSVEDVLGDVRWVWLRREDRVAQAVSWLRARQTGRFAAHQRGWGWERYDRRAIARLVQRLEEGEAHWEEVLRDRNALVVRYEEMVADPVAAVRAVLRHVGVGGEDVVVEVPMRPQADATSAEWVRRFRG